jgi:hypothetical protein
MKVNIGKYPKHTGRKFDIKIEKFDTWSLDSTLALIILPALIQLKQAKKGVPSSFYTYNHTYNQYEFEFMNETNDEHMLIEHDISEKKWNDVLDKMIWSFQQLCNTDIDRKYHHGIAKHKLIPGVDPTTNDKTYQVVDLNPNDHFYDDVGYTLHEERINQGLELFGKHLRDLWE